MKQLRTTFMALAIAALLTVPMVGIVSAQTGDIAEPIEATQEESQETTRPSAAERAATAEERRAERAAEREEAVDAARAERVATRCAVAQEKIQAAITRADEVESNRMDTYSNIATKIANIISRLDAAEIDSSTLVSQAATYNNMVDSFYAEFDVYQLALSDAAAIDCEDDTEGFILALEEARSLVESLRASAGEIKEYVRGTIFATLQDIKDSLSTDTEDASETDASTDGADSEEE